MRSWVRACFWTAQDDLGYSDACVCVYFAQLWGGCGEEQASHHSRPEGVPDGTEEELQQVAGEPAAHAGEEDSRTVQTNPHIQAPHGEVGPTHLLLDGCFTAICPFVCLEEERWRKDELTSNL